MGRKMGGTELGSTERRIELALKKQRLLLRSAQLRQAFAEQTRPLSPLLITVDRVHAGIRWLGRHPALPVAVVTALLVARPRAVFRWLRRGWFLWQALRSLRSRSAPSEGGPNRLNLLLNLLQWIRARNRAG